MSKPLVSIIIPTFNRAHIILETLDSVSAQTYKNWECIIVDDGSTDETEKLIKEYSLKDNRFKYHKRPDKHLQGGNGARNYGFNLSKGAYIQWFDSDDLMVANKIELSVLEIQSKKKDLVVSNCNFFGEPEKYERFKFDDLFEFHIGDGSINTPMCFFKKEILEGYAFDETLVRSQEFEFFTRLFSSKTISFSIIQDSLSYIRVHDDSITGKFEKGERGAIASMLFAKFSAVQLSKKLDLNIQCIAKKHFERALWKSLIFGHKNLYFKYLSLYVNQDKSISLVRRTKLRLFGLFFFTFNRGGQIIKKYFFK